MNGRLPGVFEDEVKGRRAALAANSATAAALDKRLED